jgi:hypothetical protein
MIAALLAYLVIHAAIGSATATDEPCGPSVACEPERKT